MIKPILLAATAGLALTACGDNSANMTTTTTNEAAGLENTTNMSGSATAMAPLAPADFVNAAAASDQFEIQSSQMALEKSQNADVKSFAQMLITEHQKSTADLKAAAAKATPALTPKPALNAEQRADLDALRQAGGADFDRVYLTKQVPAHQKALDMLTSYAVGGENQGLKDFASKTQGPVQKHLEQAQKLAAK